jgi:hypothetical protein
MLIYKDVDCKAKSANPITDVDAFINKLKAKLLFEDSVPEEMEAATMIDAFESAARQHERNLALND